VRQDGGALPRCMNLAEQIVQNNHLGKSLDKTFRNGAPDEAGAPGHDAYAVWLETNPFVLQHRR